MLAKSDRIQQLLCPPEFKPVNSGPVNSGPVNSGPVNFKPVPQCNSKRDVLNRLTKEVRKLEAARRTVSEIQAISTGCQELDACLPHRGYVPGSVIEYLRATPACGATYLAFAAAAAAIRDTNGFLVVVDAQQCIYPPALAAHGIALSKVVFVHPQSLADAIWAIDQSLRTPAVTVVLAELDRIDDRSARRLQLAAEAGEGLALLLRGVQALGGPSWAEVQWLVRSSSIVRPQEPGCLMLNGPAVLSEQVQAARGLQVQLVRNRGGQSGAEVHLEIHRLTGAIRPRVLSKRNHHEQKATVHLAAELASSKSASRRAAAS